MHDINQSINQSTFYSITNIFIYKGGEGCKEKQNCLRNIDHAISFDFAIASIVPLYNSVHALNNRYLVLQLALRPPWPRNLILMTKRIGPLLNWISHLVLQLIPTSPFYY